MTLIGSTHGQQRFEGCTCSESAVQCHVHVDRSRRRVVLSIRRAFPVDRRGKPTLFFPRRRREARVSFGAFATLGCIVVDFSLSRGLARWVRRIDGPGISDRRRRPAGSHRGTCCRPRDARRSARVQNAGRRRRRRGGGTVVRLPWRRPAVLRASRRGGRSVGRRRRSSESGVASGACWHGPCCVVGSQELGPSRIRAIGSAATRAVSGTGRFASAVSGRTRR